MKIVDDDGQVVAEGQVLSLEPGDVCVVQTKQRLTESEKAGAAGALEKAFPSYPWVLLDDGAELSILRRPALASNRITGKGASA